MLRSLKVTFIYILFFEKHQLLFLISLSHIVER